VAIMPRPGEFVIESDCERDNGKRYKHYRCDHEFAELIGWLRGKGVVSRTPLHTLRKEFGSQINTRFGLVAAKMDPCVARSFVALH
jgi:hypothetical protein